MGRPLRRMQAFADRLEEMGTSLHDIVPIRPRTRKFRICLRDHWWVFWQTVKLVRIAWRQSRLTS